MESRRFEEIGRGRGWADTAHTTELQPVFCSVVRIGRFGSGPVLPTGYFCPQYCCRIFGPPSLRWLSSVAWAVSAHPLPESSDTDDATEEGNRIGAHGVQIGRPSWVRSRSRGGVPSQPSPSFLRLLRLFAAKPRPCSSPIVAATGKRKGRYDRNIGTEIWARNLNRQSDISVLNIVVDTPLLF